MMGRTAQSVDVFTIVHYQWGGYRHDWL